MITYDSHCFTVTNTHRYIDTFIAHIIHNIIKLNRMILSLLISRTVVFINRTAIMLSQLAFF